MRKRLANIICCPKDSADLVLHEIHTDGEEVQEGVLECTVCGGVWTIIDAIPRFVSPSSVDLDLDMEFAERNAQALNDLKRGLADRVIERIQALKRESSKEEYSWNREEMLFWEKDYENRYHNDVTNKTTFNRILPRQKFLLDPLAEERIDTVLEIGCGTCGTMHNSPEFLNGKHFIGTDLSFNALRTGRKFVPGDFIMCDATKLPFKDEVIDLLLTFGVLHHLEQRQDAMPYLFSKIRNGGYLGFTEKLKSKIDFENSRLLGKIKDRMTPEDHRGEEHEEYIDDIKALKISGKHGEVISKRYEYSAARVVLVRLFVNKLGFNSRFVAGLIMRLDYFCIDYWSKLNRVFDGTSLVLLVKKSGAR